MSYRSSSLQAVLRWVFVVAGIRSVHTVGQHGHHFCKFMTLPSPPYLRAQHQRVTYALLQLSRHSPCQTSDDQFPQNPGGTVICRPTSRPFSTSCLLTSIESLQVYRAHVNEYIHVGSGEERSAYRSCSGLYLHLSTLRYSGRPRIEYVLMPLNTRVACLHLRVLQG